MYMKNWKSLCGILLTAVVLCGCEGGAEPKDPREAFVGDYTFVSTGSIDIYLGTVKMGSVPLDQDGNLSITLAEKSNAVWIVADNDSMQASVSGNELFMEPLKQQLTMGGMEMDLSFTYGKGTLEKNVLSIPADVQAVVSYQAMSLTGNGHVDVVATKQSK